MGTKKQFDAINYKRETLECLTQRCEKSRIWPIKIGDLLVAPTCPLCGSPRFSLLTEVYLKSRLNFFSTAACPRCLFVFRSISPSLPWFKRCWQTIKTNELEVFNPALEEDRRQRYEKYHRLIKPHKKNGRLLDIGAAFGGGTSVFKRRGFAVEAIEPEITRIDYLRKVSKIPVTAGTIEKLPSKKTYDVVIFAHCLEHLDYPDAAMAKLSRILKPDGVVYLETPILWDYVEWSDAFYMAHKSNFSLQNLKWLIAKNGFEIVKKIRYARTDVGLILRLAQNKKSVTINPGRTKRKTVDSIRKLYRKNWPLSNQPPLKDVIRYTVPAIEQFYQIIKLENKRVAASKDNSGNINFFSFETAI